MVNRPLAFPVALDRHQNLVCAEQAIPGSEYTCVECGGGMFVRGGVNTKYRAHFYHHTENHHHSVETWLHIAARQSIAQGLERAIHTRVPYAFEYRCPVCAGRRVGDLTKRAHTVQIETAWNGIIPDLLAVSRKGQPLFAIEVVVTHPPDAAARAVYARQRLPVCIVQPKLATVARLLHTLTDNLSELWNVPCESPNHPTSLALNERYCKLCGYKMKQIKVEVWNQCPCPNCKEPIRAMRVFTLGGTIERLRKARWTCVLIDEVAFGLDVHIAGRNGGRRASRAHQCPRCVTRVRDHQIFSAAAKTRWMHAAVMPERIGFYVACLRCDWWIEQHVYTPEDDSRAHPNNCTTSLCPSEANPP